VYAIERAIDHQGSKNRWDSVFQELFDPDRGSLRDLGPPEVAETASKFKDMYVNWIYPTLTATLSELMSDYEFKESLYVKIGHIAEKIESVRLRLEFEMELLHDKQAGLSHKSNLADVLQKQF
jgi:hypothetical protein